jgi:hypothetical protein
LVSDRTEVCPERAISIGVPVPSSASWVSALCRGWCRVAPPEAARTMVTIPVRLVRKLRTVRRQAVFSAGGCGGADAGGG